MKRFYSKSAGCTYLAGFNTEIPADAVEISEEIYQQVIARPLPGKVRGHDAGGLPILIDPPAPAPLTREQIEAQRLRAYADPLTGSDRHFAEATRLQVMGGTAEEVDAAKASGATRYAEIQAEYPWPEAAS